MRAKRILIRSAEVLAALLVLLLIAAGISAVVCSRHIKVTRYDVPTDGLTAPVRLVVVADLHGKEYGAGNAALCEKAAAQSPDAIVLLGDLFPSHPTQADADYVVRLTQSMQDIAQVYFAMGNHETDFTARYGSDWIDAVADTGAIVLDEAWDDFEIAGNTIRLGGTLGHGYLFGRSREAFEASSEYGVLSALEESPHPAVLLAHKPDTVALSDGKQRWHIGLVLSGHTHGGVIRVPFFGGLYTPMQGWWPRFDYGDMMLNSQMRMIITSGLSGHDFVPRIFNLPEICVVDLTPKGAANGA